MASPRFREGHRVLVKVLDPPGHNRTPPYVRGKQGVVERVHGSFKNPEQLAYGRDGLPVVPLYSVMFDWDHVWGHIVRPTGDNIIVDIFEHWLEPA